jgi:hypothetical protein
MEITVIKEVSMVDNLNPTNQFHPYQAPEFPSVSTQQAGGLMGMLDKFGINNESLRNLGSHPTVTKARDYARNNGAVVLGGLAAAVIGAGLLRRRSS